MFPFKLVTFDINGTLLKFRVPVTEKYVQTALKYGVQADPNLVKVNFKAAWRSLNEEYPNYGKKSGMTWQTWWKLFVERTFKGIVFPQNKNKIIEIYQDLLDYHDQKEAFIMRPKTEELLQFLQSKNIILGVISNYDVRLYDVIKFMNLKQYFNFVIASYDFGYAKPDVRIFQEALRLAGCKGNEAAHVGDDVEKDYFGSKKAGFRPILITSKHHPNVDENDEFSDFDQLKSYFEKLCQ